MREWPVPNSVHHAAAADRVGADLGGAVELGVLVGDAVEQLADEVDVARRRGRRHPATAARPAGASSASTSIGSHRPLFIER